MRGRAFGGRGGLIELLRPLGKVWEAFRRRLRGEEGVRIVVRVMVSFYGSILCTFMFMCGICSTWYIATIGDRKCDTESKATGLSSYAPDQLK